MTKDNLKEIKELPLLEDYPALKDALEDRELVIFIGAGVSRLLGCKSWDDLATDLLKKCLELLWQTRLRKLQINSWNWSRQYL